MSAIPTKGIILPPIYLFEGDETEYTVEDIDFLRLEIRTLTETDMVKHRSGYEEIFGKDVPVTKIVSDKENLDDISNLFYEVIVKPPRYLEFTSEFLAVVKYRFSVFQPIFVDHGFCGFLFPQIDYRSGCIYIPDNGVIFFDQDPDCNRETLPLFKNLSFRIENYIQSTYAKFDCIQEELRRRRAVRKANRKPVEQEGDLSERMECGKWSAIMTKKKACNTLGLEYRDFECAYSH